MRQSGFGIINYLTIQSVARMRTATSWRKLNVARYRPRRLWARQVSVSMWEESGYRLISSEKSVALALLGRPCQARAALASWRPPRGYEPKRDSRRRTDLQETDAHRNFIFPNRAIVPYHLTTYHLMPVLALLQQENIFYAGIHGSAPVTFVMFYYKMLPC